MMDKVKAQVNSIYQVIEKLSLPNESFFKYTIDYNTFDYIHVKEVKDINLKQVKCTYSCVRETYINHESVLIYTSRVCNVLDIIQMRPIIFSDRYAWK